MITPFLNADDFTGHILIEPNRAISWEENVRCIKIFSLLSFIIGALAMYHGLFLVMPFSGFEVIVVSVSLYLVYKRYSTCQVIYFSASSVVIESGKNAAEQRVEYQRYWSYFHIDKKSHDSTPRLRICSKGQSTEIGDFLNYEEKRYLIKHIKTLTAGYRNQNRPHTTA